MSSAMSLESSGCVFLISTLWPIRHTLVQVLVFSLSDKVEILKEDSQQLKLQFFYIFSDLPNYTCTF